MQVTLQQIRDKQPCPGGWKKVQSITDDRDEEFCVSEIIKSNDIADTLWVLKWVIGDEGKVIRRTFAIDCALRALPIFESKYPNDKRPRNAIEAAQLYLNGEITIGELKEKCTAAASAFAAAFDAHAAAYAAANTAADYAAAAAADRQKEIEWQEKQLSQLIKGERYD